MPRRWAASQAGHAEDRQDVEGVGDRRRDRRPARPAPRSEEGHREGRDEQHAEADATDVHAASAERGPVDLCDGSCRHRLGRSRRARRWGARRRSPRGRPPGGGWPGRAARSRSRRAMADDDRADGAVAEQVDDRVGDAGGRRGGGQREHPADHDPPRDAPVDRRARPPDARAGDGARDDLRGREREAGVRGGEDHGRGDRLGAEALGRAHLDDLGAERLDDPPAAACRCRARSPSRTRRRPRSGRRSRRRP